MGLLIMVIGGLLIWYAERGLYKDGYTHHQGPEWIIGVGIAMWGLTVLLG